MKRTLLFMTCVLASVMMYAQEESNDYIPFVELGKQWHVVSAPENPNYVCAFERYEMYEEEERGGKTYTQTYLLDNVLCTYREVGLFREENRRVYKYDETTGRDIMLYDFSLKEGDTFSYEYGFPEPVNCKVLKQGWLTDGPKIVTSRTLVSDTLDTRYRYLRIWTIGRDNGSGEYHKVATWVECIGAIENMFSSFGSGGRKSCLAYVERKENQTGYWENKYLPFSFCGIYDVFGQVHGCNLPTGTEEHAEDYRHQLTYELVGNRLHVYGKVFTQCGPNNYAYFYERSTDDPSVHKIEFEIQEVEPLADCMALHTTNFYVPGFDPNMNYIVVDNYGEEHPVINKTPQMAYRPFIEEGKVWKVGGAESGNPVERVEYYYFDGDTIINGKPCKQMMRQRFVSPNHPDYAIFSQWPSLSYVGAWYEEDKKVYFCREESKEFNMMYDFSLEAYDTLQVDGGLRSYVIGPRETGGLKGFKGVYRDIMWAGELNRYNTTWLEGIGNIDGPTYSVYLGKEYHALFLMSCTVGDEVIYLNDEYEDGATSDVCEARKVRFDFTHTVKTQPKAPIKRETSDACISSSEREVARPNVRAPRRVTEKTLYGEFNALELDVNLDPLDDVYQVRIIDASGKTVYEKTINAGNIVGLNIDISTFAEGSYTVSVENSRESFVGVFNSDTTGIEEVKSKRLEPSDHNIYDLQGRRLSGKPTKGLYIQNGVKRVVR